MINPSLALSRDAIAAFCRKHRIRRLSLFGSATREDFRPDSDVDVLLEFAEDARASLFDLVDLQDELKDRCILSLRTTFRPASG
ncbi:nucleotidyltransferase family protein [Methylotetracoccus oryzae]|uniref:nucleotidyltransferase family protein n=1 Tax=Methylotetracoccus oryzae TaxID=1919059 RepID=UPI001118A4F3|nr:nucleotidyltransferase domain-containing protein [Methylotetracoccus oryzae]